MNSFNSKGGSTNAPSFNAANASGKNKSKKDRKCHHRNADHPKDENYQHHETHDTKGQDNTAKPRAASSQMRSP